MFKFFVFENEIVFEYDKKLVMVRLLFVNMIEIIVVENEWKSIYIES